MQAGTSAAFGRRLSRWWRSVRGGRLGRSGSARGCRQARGERAQTGVIHTQRVTQLLLCIARIATHVGAADRHAVARHAQAELRQQFFKPLACQPAGLVMQPRGTRRPIEPTCRIGWRAGRGPRWTGGIVGFHVGQGHWLGRLQNMPKLVVHCSPSAAALDAEQPAKHGAYRQPSARQRQAAAGRLAGRRGVGAWCCNP